MLTNLFADFEAQPTSGIYPLEVQFTDLSDAGSTNLTDWMWAFGDGDTSYVRNPNHTYETPGTYDVSLTVWDTLGRTGQVIKHDYISIPIMYGDVDLNTMIQAYDAGLILQNLIGLGSLDSLQIESGNVSMDTTLSALDASLILQYVVGILDSLPFDSAETQLLASGEITMEDLGLNPGSPVDIPVYLEDGSNIYSFEGELRYNPDALVFDSLSWNGTIEDFTIETVLDSGSMRFAAAGTQPDGEDVTFVQLHFTVQGDFTGDTTMVTLSKFRFNEGPVLINSTQSILSTALWVEREMGIPDEFALHQNYPNPFNPLTKIQYDIPKKTDHRLVIYDILGRTVKTVAEGEIKPGYYEVTWDGTDSYGVQVSTGVYFYRLKTEEFTDVGKMIFMK